MIKEKLRKDFKVVTDWFFGDYKSLNPTKCHYMRLGKNKKNDTFKLRSLRIVNGDNHSSFKSLLSKYQEITINQRNLQVLMTETYKIINGISPLLSPPNLPNEYNLATSLHDFKLKIKNWHCDKFVCYAKIFCKI